MKNDFKTNNNDEEYWYDTDEDWSLIESSFLNQYGIRLRMIDDMSYDEFCSYLSGIMPDTPLGTVVRIRSETDREIIENFTAEQRRIRNEWLGKLAKNKSEIETKTALESILNSFKELAGEGGKVKGE